ncbi:MAG: sensor histidine kinase [Jatrophihabitans sp.]
MTHTWRMLVLTVIWALGGGLAAWLVTIPLRRRSFAAQLATPVLIATVASVAAFIGSVQAMYLPTHEFWAALAVALAAGLVASVAALSSAHRMARDKQGVVEALRALGRGTLPPSGAPRMTAELDALRTEVADTAQRLADSRHREQSLESSHRELLGWVSRDLRIPLAQLHVLTEELENGTADTPERSYKQLHIEVEMLGEMLDDLGELSALHVGGPRTADQVVRLDDLVAGCVAALEPMADTRGVRLARATAESVIVSGDGRELNRALTNLMVNAIRHTAVAGTVAVAVQPPSGDLLARVVVSDGCGRQREPDDAGALSLAISRGIIEAHDGTVVLDRDDLGCRYVVRLPAKV